VGVGLRGEARADGGTELLVTVTDSGPGISPDDAESVFQRGWSTKPAPDGGPGRQRGRGLGLALVRQTVHRHGGTVDVGTGRHGGAEFTVRMPLRGAT
jgi:two-component system, CitB family, sensor kinase